MVLVDRDIRALVQNGYLISENYKPENLGCVSYDLTIDNVIAEDDITDEYIIKPKEFVIVKTNEELNIPVNMIGRIVEKNSLLRLGLYVSGPVYQPGHKTYSFLRVYNLSNTEISLKKDFKIAQIFFEELTEIPEETYDKKAGASFNNESKYLRYGKYEEQYNSLKTDKK